MRNYWHKLKKIKMTRNPWKKELEELTTKYVSKSSYITIQVEEN